MNPTETDKNNGTTTRPGEGESGAAPEATETPETAGTAGKATAGDTPENARGAADGTSAEGVDFTKSADASEPADSLEGDEFDEEGDDADVLVAAPSSGLLSAAAAIIATALAFVGLSGSWVGRIAAERQTLLGQIETSQGSPAEQISAIYGDAWHTTALVNGVFATLALILGLAVLSRPAKPGWVRAFAVAGAVLGGIGILISVGMYFDLIVGLPKAG
ncbi:hypothetical protein [Streptomyces sp. NPDC020965]|uniref:hypothetical protein n=1 Tax=Streptomyces sp. NPDC020965 TaxID=3365105 RepID=UPI0037BB1E7D